MSTTHATGTRPGRLLRPIIGVAIILALAVVAVLATGWLGRREGEAEGRRMAAAVVTDPVVRAAAAVPWQDYRPGAQSDLEAADCEHLAAAYTGAAVADETMREDKGHGSDAIAAYIVALATDKGCTWQK